MRYNISAFCIALFGMLLTCGCQGPLEDSITELFETYEEGIGAANSSGGSSSISGSNQNSDNIARKLVGRWQLVKQTFIEDGEEDTRTDFGDRYWMELNADFTYKVGIAELFEAEKRGHSWSILDNRTIIFDNDNDDMYRIMTVNSSNLTLGWIDEEGGKSTIVEISVFRRI